MFAWLPQNHEFSDVADLYRTAEIVIKLRNRGPDAYKHDIYGDSIIIERKLSQDGSGSYKLKSSKCKFNFTVVFSQ